MVSNTRLISLMTKIDPQRASRTTQERGKSGTSATEQRSANALAVRKLSYDNTFLDKMPSGLQSAPQWTGYGAIWGDQWADYGAIWGPNNASFYEKKINAIVPPCSKLYFLGVCSSREIFSTNSWGRRHGRSP